MASTLSFGFERPATGDKGSVFWPILEDNITRTNDHTHNGTNSSKLTTVAQTATTQAVSNASWGATIGGGLFRQTITLPAALTAVSGTYDDYAIEIRNAANGRRLYLATEKVTSTTFYIFINDDTLNLTLVYT